MFAVYHHASVNFQGQKVNLQGPGHIVAASRTACSVLPAAANDASSALVDRVFSYSGINAMQISLYDWATLCAATVLLFFAWIAARIMLFDTDELYFDCWRIFFFAEFLFVLVVLNMQPQRNLFYSHLITVRQHCSRAESWVFVLSTEVLILIWVLISPVLTTSLTFRSNI